MTRSGAMVRVVLAVEAEFVLATFPREPVLAGLGMSLSTLLFQGCEAVVLTMLLAAVGDTPRWRPLESDRKAFVAVILGLLGYLLISASTTPCAWVGWDTWTAIRLVLVGVIAEELACRVLLQSALRRLGLAPALAIPLAALFFAGAHFGLDIGQFFEIVVFGLFYGWIWESTGSASLLVVAHGGHNAVLLGVGWLQAGNLPPCPT